MTASYPQDSARFEARRAAELAHIALSAEEAAELQAQAEDILAWVGQLRDVDVAGVSPTENVAEGETVWREDVPVAGLDRDTALQQAPLSRQGHFVVPKVLE